VRARAIRLCDRSATGASPEDNLRAAIAAHDGEAAASRDAFALLSPVEQQHLLAFLDSLGRLEFDFEGNNNVDALDWFFLENAGAFTGPGSFFTPDSPAAVADFDQDGDFDLKDFVLQRATSQPEALRPIDASLQRRSCRASPLTNGPIVRTILPRSRKRHLQGRPSAFIPPARWGWMFTIGCPGRGPGPSAGLRHQSKEALQVSAPARGPVRGRGSGGLPEGPEGDPVRQPSSAAQAGAVPSAEAAVAAAPLARR
jgi:hypothetical protein